jgi:hypothetical protein
MDPLAQAGASASEFGSAPVGKAPELSADNFSQVKAVNPPADFTGKPQPITMPVDEARSAVDQAIAAAPFDPAFGGAVQSLNAQPLSRGPIHAEAPPADVNNLPPLPSSDTPMLVLPSDNQSSVTATQPIANQATAPQAAASGVAPPPVPPPLNVAPGTIAPAAPSPQ